MNDYRIDELRTAIASAHITAPGVSNWSVGMHVHHCCLVMIGVSRSLDASSPPPPPARTPWIRRVVFTTGRLVRGRAQSPERVVPRADITTAELALLLDEAVSQVTTAGNLEAGRWFKHFVFGVLKRDDALRFLHIHNRHHLRIVSDIVSAQKGKDP